MVNIKVLAHRGNHDSKYNQNTKDALISALECHYIDGVELDVRMTKDKKIVIIHDPLINNVSDGAGIVKDMTLKQLSKYNFGTKENPCKISLLNDFFNQIDTDKIIMIEIKEEQEGKLTIADKVMDIVNQYPNLKIYICSFNYGIMKYLNSKYHYQYGLLVGLSLNENKLQNHFYFNIISPNHLDKIDKRKETFVWTINSEEEFKKIKVDNVCIITDYPQLIYSLIISQPPKLQ